MNYSHRDSLLEPSHNISTLKYSDEPIYEAYIPLSDALHSSPDKIPAFRPFDDDNVDVATFTSLPTQQSPDNYIAPIYSEILRSFCLPFYHRSVIASALKQQAGRPPHRLSESLLAYFSQYKETFPAAVSKALDPSSSRALSLPSPVFIPFPRDRLNNQLYSVSDLVSFAESPATFHNRLIYRFIPKPRNKTYGASPSPQHDTGDSITTNTQVQMLQVYGYSHENKVFNLLAFRLASYFLQHGGVRVSSDAPTTHPHINTYRLSDPHGSNLLHVVHKSSDDPISKVFPRAKDTMPMVNPTTSQSPHLNPITTPITTPTPTPTPTVVDVSGMDQWCRQDILHFNEGLHNTIISMARGNYLLFQCPVVVDIVKLHTFMNDNQCNYHPSSLYSVSNTSPDDFQSSSRWLYNHILEKTLLPSPDKLITTIDTTITKAKTSINRLPAAEGDPMLPSVIVRGYADFIVRNSASPLQWTCSTTGDVYEVNTYDLLDTKTRPDPSAKDFIQILLYASIINYSIAQYLFGNTTGQTNVNKTTTSTPITSSPTHTKQPTRTCGMITHIGIISSECTITRFPLTSTFPFNLTSLSKSPSSIPSSAVVTLLQAFHTYLNRFHPLHIPVDALSSPSSFPMLSTWHQYYLGSPSYFTYNLHYQHRRKWEALGHSAFLVVNCLLSAFYRNESMSSTSSTVLTTLLNQRLVYIPTVDGYAGEVPLIVKRMTKAYLTRSAKEARVWLSSDYQTKSSPKGSRDPQEEGTVSTSSTEDTTSTTRGAINGYVAMTLLELYAFIIGTRHKFNSILTSARKQHQRRHLTQQRHNSHVQSQIDEKVLVSSNVIASSSTTTASMISTSTTTSIKTVTSSTSITIRETSESRMASQTTITVDNQIIQHSVINTNNNHSNHHRHEGSNNDNGVCHVARVVDINESATSSSCFDGDTNGSTPTPVSPSSPSDQLVDIEKDTKGFTTPKKPRPASMVPSTNTLPALDTSTPAFDYLTSFLPSNNSDEDVKDCLAQFVNTSHYTNNTNSIPRLYSPYDSDDGKHSAYSSSDDVDTLIKTIPSETLTQFLFHVLIMHLRNLFTSVISYTRDPVVSNLFFLYHQTYGDCHIYCSLLHAPDVLDQSDPQQTILPSPSIQRFHHASCFQFLVSLNTPSQSFIITPSAKTDKPLAKGESGTGRSTVESDTQSIPQTTESHQLQTHQSRPLDLYFDIEAYNKPIVCDTLVRSLMTDNDLIALLMLCLPTNAIAIDNCSHTHKLTVRSAHPDNDHGYTSSVDLLGHPTTTRPNPSHPIHKMASHIASIMWPRRNGQSLVTQWLDTLNQPMGGSSSHKHTSDTTELIRKAQSYLTKLGILQIDRLFIHSFPPLCTPFSSSLKSTLKDLYNVLEKEDELGTLHCGGFKMEEDEYTSLVQHLPDDDIVRRGHESLYYLFGVAYQLDFKCFINDLQFQCTQQSSYANGLSNNKCVVVEIECDDHHQDGTHTQSRKAVDWQHDLEEQFINANRLVVTTYITPLHSPDHPPSHPEHPEEYPTYMQRIELTPFLPTKTSPFHMYCNVRGHPVSDGDIDSVITPMTWDDAQTLASCDTPPALATTDTTTSAWLERIGPVTIFIDFWAHTFSQEKQLFESFLSFLWDMWREHPGIDVYHYHRYEITALEAIYARYGEECEKRYHQAVKEFILPNYLSQFESKTLPADIIQQLLLIPNYAYILVKLGSTSKAIKADPASTYYWLEQYPQSISSTQSSSSSSPTTTMDHDGDDDNDLAVQLSRLSLVSPSNPSKPPAHPSRASVGIQLIDLSADYLNLIRSSTNKMSLKNIEQLPLSVYTLRNATATQILKHRQRTVTGSNQQPPSSPSSQSNGNSTASHHTDGTERSGDVQDGAASLVEYAKFRRVIIEQSIHAYNEWINPGFISDSLHQHPILEYPSLYLYNINSFSSFMVLGRYDDDHSPLLSFRDLYQTHKKKEVEYLHDFEKSMSLFFSEYSVVKPPTIQITSSSSNNHQQQLQQQRQQHDHQGRDLTYDMGMAETCTPSSPSPSQHKADALQSLYGYTSLPRQTLTQYYHLSWQRSKYLAALRYYNREDCLNTMISHRFLKGIQPPKM